MKRLLFYSVLLCLFLIPLSQFLSVRFIVLSLTISVVHLFKEPGKSMPRLKRSLDLLLFLSISVAGLLYSNDLTAGLKVIETKFSLLAMCIVFVALGAIDEDKFINMVYAFTAGLLLACIISLINAGISFSQTSNIEVFLYDQLTSAIKIQPVYFAYYLIFSITLGLYFLYYGQTKLSQPVLIFIVSFFFSVLMLTGGRTALVSLLFIFSFFILKFLVEENRARRGITFGLICVMTVCMFLISASDQGVNKLNDAWERFDLWESGIKAIPDLILGVGTGDYKTVLNEYYKTHGLIQYAHEGYNSHNQFIQILLTNGILGLISLLVLLCRPLYVSLRSQHVLGVLVFFPFLIYGTTEVFLGRYQGIVFFASLHQIFMSYYFSVRPSYPFLDKVNRKN